MLNNTITELIGSAPFAIVANSLGVKGSVANNEHLETNTQLLEIARSTSIKTKALQKTISETTSNSKSKKVRSFGLSFGIYVMIAGALLFGFGIYKMRKQWKLM